MPSWVADFLERNPDVAGRRITRRDRHALHFAAGGRDRIAVCTAHPLHFRRGRAWAPIDTQLQQHSSGALGGPHTPVLLREDGSVAIRGGSYAHHTRRVGLLNQNGRFTPLADLGSGVVQGDTLHRQGGPFAHTITLTEDGAREELLITACPAGDSAALLAVETEMAGITLPDGPVTEERQQDGYTFTLPSAVDARGVPAPCWAFARRVAGRQMLYTGIPLSWLAGAAYPVLLDPDFTVNTNSGRVSGQASTYATARGTGTQDLNNQTVNIVGQFFAATPLYICYRQYLRFDTSSIGSGSTVTSVTMTLTATADSSTTDFDVQIVKYDWSSLSPVSSNIDAVYDGILAGTADNNIWRNTNGMSINTNYASGALDTSWVSKTAYSYYGLRSSRDASNTAPGGTEYITLGGVANGTSAYRPFLTVAYTVPTYAPPPVRRPLRVWPVRR